MSGFPWLKLWNEAPDDPKWLAIADVAGSSPAVVWTTFSKSLAHANQNDPRGSITGLHPQVVASWCRVPLDEIRRIFQAFRELGILIGDRIAKWTKRQTEKLAKPRSADAERQARQNAERQARHRAKAAAAAAQGTLDLAVTPPSPALLSSVTSGGEKEEEEEFNSEADASEREPACAEIVQITSHRKETRGVRGCRKSRISADWQPDDQDRGYAAAKGYDYEWVETQAERFRDHHLKTGSLCADWNAGWRTWVQRADDFAGRNQGARSGGDRGGPGTILAAFRRIDAYREKA